VLLLLDHSTTAATPIETAARFCIRVQAAAHGR
jgi:hypothetical protein